MIILYSHDRAQKFDHRQDRQTHFEDHNLLGTQESARTCPQVPGRDHQDR